MSRRVLLLMAVLLAVLIGGFSYLRALARRILVETWPHREEAVRTRLSEAMLQPTSGRQQNVTLYFLSPDRSQLAPEMRSMALAASEPDRIRQVLLALIEGSHQGYNPVLPTSAEVRAVFLSADGSVYLDFSNDFVADFRPGIASETLAIRSIVNTLGSNIPAIRRVKILIEGQEPETLDGHADLSHFFVLEKGPAAPAL